MHCTYINQMEAASLFGFTPLASLAFPKLMTMTWIPSLRAACPLPSGGLRSRERERADANWDECPCHEYAGDGRQKRERKNPLSDPAPAGVAAAPKRPFKVMLHCGDQAELKV